jgi:hypothetical protein
MEQTECSETSVYKIQTPWNYPDESTQVVFLPASEMSILALEMGQRPGSKLRLKRGGTRAETKFRLSPKRTSPFKSAGASVQPTAGSRVVRISVSNAGYTTFRGGVRVLAAHSIRQFPLYFPSRASPCAIRFRTQQRGSLIV